MSQDNQVGPGMRPPLALAVDGGRFTRVGAETAQRFADDYAAGRTEGKVYVFEFPDRGARLRLVPLMPGADSAMPHVELLDTTFLAGQPLEMVRACADALWDARLLGPGESMAWDRGSADLRQRAIGLLVQAGRLVEHADGAVVLPGRPETGSASSSEAGSPSVPTHLGVPGGPVDSFVRGGGDPMRVPERVMLAEVSYLAESAHPPPCCSSLVVAGADTAPSSEAQPALAHGTVGDSEPPPMDQATAPGAHRAAQCLAALPPGTTFARVRHASPIECAPLQGPAWEVRATHGTNIVIDGAALAEVLAHPSTPPDVPPAE